MRQLRINPKEVGSTIKIGKLPIFTRSLTAMADLNDVVQIVVEGRYYAVELRKSGLEKALDEMREQMGAYTTNYTTVTETETPVEAKEEQQPAVEEKFTPFKTHYQIGRDRFKQLKELEKSGALAECKNRLDICEKLGFEPQIRGTGYNWLSNQVKKGFLEERLVRYNKQNSGEYEYHLTGLEPNYSGNKHIAERAKSQGLEEMGFVNLSKPAKQMQVKVKRHPRAEGVDYAGRPVERGHLSLWEWLNRDDYVISKLFLSDTGRPLLEKLVDYDDICLVFLNEGLPDRGKRNPAEKGKTAQNYTNVVIAQLLRKGILQKDEESGDGKKMYSLTLTKGGAYARSLFKTIREGKYSWDAKNYRRFVEIA